MRKQTDNQILYVDSFKDLVQTDFIGQLNAACWLRTLRGDFEEIVKKLEQDENITEVLQEDLLALDLSPKGQLAREILLKDLQLLTEQGADPVLNIIKYYDRDEENALFPTDVYSFHVDRSPVPSYTFLCTYYGEPTEILPNSEAIQNILIPEIRNELKKTYDGPDQGFDTYLKDNYFDLHYQAKIGVSPISLGLGHLWRLSIDHPDNKALPCIHRAPQEKTSRLLLIC